jgi:hypothetical protein
VLTHYRNTRILALTSALIGVCFALGSVALLTGWLPFEAHANEPQVLPATLVELACAAAMLWAAAGLRTLRPSAFRGAMIAHVGVIMGVLISMISFALGVGKSGQAVTIYQLTMLFALVVNTAGVWNTRPRNLIKRPQHRITARLS